MSLAGYLIRQGLALMAEESNMVNFLSSVYFKFLCADAQTGNQSQVARVLSTIQDMLRDILLPFIIVVGAASGIYGIWLGVNYSKSEGDARADAKKRIVNFIIGLVCIIVLIVLLALYTQYADGIIAWIDKAVETGRKK